MLKKLLRVLGFLLFVVPGCDNIALTDPPGIEVNMPADSLVFAVIGDYGLDSENEAAVADLVKSWNPDFIITTGDNNYDQGEMSTIENNISKHYGDYIYNYDAEEQYRCNGKAFDEQVNRFFPSPGNHDTYGISGMKPYLNFFTLPGNEVYYSFTWSDIAFYALNSTASFMAEQESWLEEQLVNSDKTINIVYFHHSPYSTGRHGNERKMQLDYHTMDVDVVFTGHDHIYSRIEKRDEKGIYYVINGASGKSLYECGANPLDEDEFSVTCYDGDFGAIKGTWDGSELTIAFYAVSDSLRPVDTFSIVP
jgi:predicted phosphodiesterase